MIVNFENNTAIGFEKYVELLGNVYRIMFGENPDSKEMDVYYWAIYLVFTIIIQIVSLNLLISIVSDTYDRVKSE